jgi:hypothetical protein
MPLDRRRRDASYRSMLIALSAIQEPLSVWLLPHMLAAFVGALIIVFRQANYRFSLRGLLLVIATLSLLLGVMSDGLRWHFAHWEQVVTTRFWLAKLISLFIAVVGAMLLCRFCYSVFKDNRDTGT